MIGCFIVNDTNSYPICPNCNDKCSNLDNGKHIYTKKDNCCKCNDVLLNKYISCRLHEKGIRRSYYKRKHPKFKEVARYFNTLFREESMEYIERANEIEEWFEQEADRLLSELDADFDYEVVEKLFGDD